MSWWRTEVNRLREENEAVKNLASALHERLWEVESERDEWQDRYRDLQSEYARQSQAWSEQRAYYEDRLARAEQLRDERDDALSAGLEALGDAERDRDEAVARAEAAERDRDDDYSERSQKAAAWDRVAVHPALKIDLLPEADHTYAGGVFERITWLAEAAEARTAPTVTRDDIEKAIRGKVWAANRDPNKAGFHRVHIAWATDSVWSLVSGADPAVHVVRESDIEDCQRNEDGDWEFRHSGRVFYDSRDPADRAESLTHHREQVAQRVAIIRAIEAEPADPLLDKAQEFAALADWELTDREAELLHTVAAHVLGQEGRHVDQ